jgi:hypothetical protein
MLQVSVCWFPPSGTPKIFLDFQSISTAVFHVEHFSSFTRRQPAVEITLRFSENDAARTALDLISQ